MDYTDNLLRICYYAPYISPFIVPWLQRIYYLYIAFPIYCAGVTLLSKPRRKAVMGVAITIIAYIMIWRIAALVQWKRPADFLAICPEDKPGLILDIEFNLYGAPDSFMPIAVVFMVDFLYSELIIFKRKWWELYGMIVLLMVSHPIAEFLGNRITVAQYFTNLLITIVLSILTIVCAHHFYDIHPNLIIEDKPKATRLKRIRKRILRLLSTSSSNGKKKQQQQQRV